VDRHGHSEERVHLRVVPREAEAPRVLHQVLDPDRPVLADDQAQDAVAARGRPDQ
jgi:hypothetical protein